MDDLIEKARVKQRKLETYAVGSDGEFECTQELDCNSCSEQVVCDTIRDVIRIRKGDRVVTIGEEEGPEADRSKPPCPAFGGVAPSSMKIELV